MKGSAVAYTFQAGVKIRMEQSVITILIPHQPHFISITYRHQMTRTLQKFVGLKFAQDKKLTYFTMVLIIVFHSEPT